jgi:hypothetical protein
MYRMEERRRSLQFAVKTIYHLLLLISYRLHLDQLRGLSIPGPRAALAGCRTALYQIWITVYPCRNEPPTKQIFTNILLSYKLPSFEALVSGVPSSTIMAVYDEVPIR